MRAKPPDETEDNSNKEWQHPFITGTASVTTGRAHAEFEEAEGIVETLGVTEQDPGVPLNLAYETPRGDELGVLVWLDPDAADRVARDLLEQAEYVREIRESTDSHD